MQRDTLLPIEESRSFFSVVNDSDEVIGEFSIDYNTTDNIFYTKIRSGTVPVGEEFSFVSSDNVSNTVIYSGLETFKDSILYVDGPLNLDGEVNFNGTIEVENKITFKGSSIYFHEDSVIRFNNTLESLDEVFSGSDSTKVHISGTIIIPFNCIDDLYELTWVEIDDSVTIIPIYDSTDDRILSMTKYNDMLAQSGVTIRTQSDMMPEKSVGKLGYKWLTGESDRGYEVIALRSMTGQNIFGDYKLHVLGTPSSVLDNRHIVSEVIIEEDSTLYISDEFNGDAYNYPVMHIGSLDGTNGVCRVYGNLICNYNGPERYKGVISLNNGGTLIIAETGYLQLTDGNKIISNELSGGKMIINGTVEIDDITQIQSFTAGDISFGVNGKLIIKNTTYEPGTVLWTTPNGIQDTDLYRLFYPNNNLTHVEYHIPEGILVGIDKYVATFEDIPHFYNDLRFENAVFKKLIIWEDGAGLQLSSEYKSEDGTTWINASTSLYEIAMIFKNAAATTKERLQEVVNHLKYAGFGTIKFVIDGKDAITLRLKSPQIRTITKDANGDYKVENYYRGILILNNELDNYSIDSIITDPEKMVTLYHDKETEGEVTQSNVFNLH